MGEHKDKDKVVGELCGAKVTIEGDGRAVKKACISIGIMAPDAAPEEEKPKVAPVSKK